MKYLSSTGQFISQVTDCSGVYCIASNGKHLFIGYNNGEIKVIDYHTRYESQVIIQVHLYTCNYTTSNNTLYTVMYYTLYNTTCMYSTVIHRSLFSCEFSYIISG